MKAVKSELILDEPMNPELANQEKLFVALETFEGTKKDKTEIPPSNEKDVDNESLLAVFLKKIKNYPVLSRKEELALINDPEKEKKLVMHNLYLLINYAKNFAYRTNSGIDIMDLIQEGFFGLSKAAEKFEFKGYRFNTYARWCIRNKIIRYLYDKGRGIRIPVYVNVLLSRLAQVENNLKQKLQRHPTEKELAQNMCMTIKKFRALKDIKKVISLSSPMYNHRGEEGDLLEQFILDTCGKTPEEKVITNESQKDVWPLARQVFVGIKDGERLFYVLEQRYASDGRTLEDIGEELGMTRERVRQLEILALKRFRPYKIRERFEQFR